MSSMPFPPSEKGNLLVAGRDAVTLAETYGTPLFVYDVDLIRRNIRNYQRAFDEHKVPHLISPATLTSTEGAAQAANWAPPRYQIAYASKALSITAIYEIMKTERNVAVDVVSGGEMFTALHAGVDPRTIHFHGNNKSEEEVRFGLRSGIGCFVVDSFHELDLLDRLAAEAGRPQLPPVHVLLRVSPGVTAHTHEYNTTGRVDSKFGFDVLSGQAQRAYARVAASPRLRFIGLHCHIGSQIFSTEGYALAARRLLELADSWGVLPREHDEAAGRAGSSHDAGVADEHHHRFVLNMGGGYGIAYRADDAPIPSARFVDAVLNTITAFLTEKVAEQQASGQAQRQGATSTAAHGGYFFPEICIEPGRSLVGAAGTTLYTVGARKTIPSLPRNYVAVDGGMSDNIRPVLYQAEYTAYVANRMREHKRFATLSAEEQKHELEQSTRDTTATTSQDARNGSCTGMEVCTVVGKLCETGDQLIRDAPLPCATQSGDILAVLCTGAYGYAMASNYNRMRRPAILFVEGTGSGEADVTPRERIVVKRETFEDLVRNDVSFAK